MGVDRPDRSHMIGITDGLFTHLKSQTIFKHLSNVENPVDIPLNPDWLIGILISWPMKQSPYNWVVFHPLYTANNQGFGHCSFKEVLTIGFP